MLKNLCLIADESVSFKESLNASVEINLGKYYSGLNRQVISRFFPPRNADIFTKYNMR